MTSLCWTSLMSEVAEPFCNGLTAYLNQQLASQGAAEVHFLPEVDFARRRENVMAQAVEMAWICGVDYVMNAGRADWSYEPLVALCVDDGPKPVYYSEMIVRADSCARSFSDLRGATWAYNEACSWSGYKIVGSHLAELGESGPFFGDKIASGSHRNSIEMVRQGRAATAAIDSTVISMGLIAEPSLLTDLRIVERLGPYPMPPLVLSQGCPPDLRNRLQAFLTRMHQTPAGAELLAHWQVKRFDSVADSDYDDIRTSLDRSMHIEL